MEKLLLWKKLHRKNRNKESSVISTLWNIYFFKDSPVSVMTLLVWKIQQRPPKLRAEIASAERMIPVGSLLIQDKPPVISKTEVITGAAYIKWFGIKTRIPLLIIVNRIRYPQSLIKIKKLSIIQASMNWKIFSVGDVCFFVLKSVTIAGLVKSPKRRALP